jgi:hypothetical protein
LAGVVVYHRKLTGIPNVDRVFDHVYSILNKINSVPGSSTIGSSYAITPEGGIAFRVINGSTSAISKGFLVRASSSANRSVILAVPNSFDIIGAVYNTIAPGAYGYVVHTGPADVWFNQNGSTRQNYFRMTNDGDTTGDVVGKAQSDAVESPDSLMVLGYVFDTRSGEGLARCFFKR